MSNNLDVFEERLKRIQNNQGHTAKQFASESAKAAKVKPRSARQGSGKTLVLLASAILCGTVVAVLWVLGSPDGSSSVAILRDAFVGAAN